MATVSLQSFGDLLRHYRLAAGLTQEELADQAGLSVRGLSDLERGARRAPRRETVQLLALALHLSAAERAIGRSPGVGSRRSRHLARASHQLLPALPHCLLWGVPRNWPC